MGLGTDPWTHAFQDNPDSPPAADEEDEPADDEAADGGEQEAEEPVENDMPAKAAAVDNKLPAKADGSPDNQMVSHLHLHARSG
jgi:hypothetical protein